MTADTRFRLGIGLVALAFVTACDAGAPSGHGADRPPPQVRVAAVHTRDLPFEKEYAGRAAGQREVEVRAQVSGILLERTYVEGQKVEKGDVLFRIDPKPYEVALERAQAGMAEATARLEAAERDWARTQELFARKIVSEAVRDNARSARDLAKANVALAEAEVKSAEISLDYTTVEAPISGIAGREAVPEGTLVGTGPGDSLLTRLTQLDPIYVNFAIPDAEWMRQRQLFNTGELTSAGERGLVAELKLPDGGLYARRGNVDFTDTIIDQDTGTIRARATFPNPDGDILPGQFVRVTVKGMTRKGVIVVPEIAVAQGAEGPFVYRVTEDNLAQLAPVSLGTTTREGFIIEKGLRPGDRIILEGTVKVQPGNPVQVTELPAQPVQVGARLREGDRKPLQ